MEKKLFSVIIPLYNKRDNIEHTLTTVLSQTLSDFEVIVIDDGSTDGGGELVSKFTDERVRLIAQENKGVSAARNHGVREALGKYVAFLDADDEWTEDFLSECLRLFEKYPQAKMVSPSYQVRYAKKIVVPQWKSNSLDEEDCLLGDFFEMATGAFWTTNSSCVAIEKSVFSALDRWFPEEERVYEDFDMWIRIGAKYPVAHSNKICATYNRVTPNNAREIYRKKVIFSSTYFNTLSESINSTCISQQQKEWLWQIRDRRIVVYVFSLLSTRQRKKAKKVIKEWETSKPYKKYKICLKFATFMPYFIIDIVQSIRLRIF